MNKKLNLLFLLVLCFFSETLAAETKSFSQHLLERINQSGLYSNKVVETESRFGYENKNRANVIQLQKLLISYEKTSIDEQYQFKALAKYQGQPELIDVTQRVHWLVDPFVADINQTGLLVMHTKGKTDVVAILADIPSNFINISIL